MGKQGRASRPDKGEIHMKFVKMHGTGNDYVYINCFEEPFPENPSELSVKISDRHFGVGSDGLILICPSETADFQMIMYNADGSRSQMCGNGIRCVGKYVYDIGMTDKRVITVETLAGIKKLELNIEEGAVSSIKVDMGAPILEPSKIPVLSGDGMFLKRPVEVCGSVWHVTAVSMGNPHGVVFLDDIKNLDLEKLGPAFENHPLFPERVNAEFVRVCDRESLEMRVWERGTGETMSCGTGCCAVLVAAVLGGYADRKAKVTVPGGTLLIEWDEKTGSVFMTGPAEFVFSGEYPFSK